MRMHRVGRPGACPNIEPWADRGRLGLVARRHGGRLVDQGGRRARDPGRGWRSRGDGRRLGDRGRIRCRLGLGSRGRAGLGRATVSSDGRSSRSRASSSARSAGRPFVGDVDQIVLDARLAPLPPVGLEPTADRVDRRASSRSRSVEVLAGSLAHLQRPLGRRRVGRLRPHPTSERLTEPGHR